MRLPEFSGRAFLAPMAGVSDPALRLLARRQGAALVATEFTSIHGIVARGGRPGAGVPAHSEEERPVAVQLFGSDVDVLVRAARAVAPHFDIIDYNMGCPAPHITRQMAGAALLQEGGLTRRIFRALTGAVDRPVTLKVRAGVTDADRRLFLGIAETAQDEGVSMITLHPRTASQGYAGRSDWSLIRELKRAVRVPVVGNGDIVAPEDASRMIRETGCDYVMVGRGAMGNPFLFRQINDHLGGGSYREYTVRDRAGAFMEYVGLATKYGTKLSALKSQAMRFTRGAAGAPRLRARIAASQNAREVAAAVREFCM